MLIFPIADSELVLPMGHTRGGWRSPAEGCTRGVHIILRVGHGC